MQLLDRLSRYPLHVHIIFKLELGIVAKQKKSTQSGVVACFKKLLPFFKIFRLVASTSFSFILVMPSTCVFSWLLKLLMLLI
jgi:hypothetical protein